MKAINRILSMGLSCIILTSCASMSDRTKTIIGMIGVGIVTGTIAANVAAQKGESTAANGLVWGLGAAATTGAASLFIYDNENKRIEAERKLEVASRELNNFKESSGNGTEKLFESNSTLESNLPPQYKGLIEPGKYSIYKTNHWVSQGDNVLVHEDVLVRMVPAQLKPNQSESIQKQ